MLKPNPHSPDFMSGYECIDHLEGNKQLARAIARAERRAKRRIRKPRRLDE